ncbi:MAG TPA: carboxypeptidase-like regulatory domain-containing protein, partial [Terriglobales bacterium]|nr:carboxypeptidase-like regulatory domain-containing protein [Terriglobales bacterium]
MSSLKKLRVLVCLLAFLLASVVAAAQVGNQASVEGTVTDPSGAVVPDVAIQLTNTGTGAVFTGASNESGYFRFPVVPVGTYELTVQSSGFSPFVLKPVEVAVGAKLNLPVSLGVAGKKEAVEVTGEVPVVETTRTQVSSTVDAASVSDLPVNGRNFIDFVLLTPG